MHNGSCLCKAVTFEVEGGTSWQFKLRFHLFDGAFKFVKIDLSYLGPYYLQMNSNQLPPPEQVSINQEMKTAAGLGKFVGGGLKQPHFHRCTGPVGHCI